MLLRRRGGAGITEEVTLRQAGGSASATLPKDMADRLRLAAGDRVLAVETDRGILPTPYDPAVERALAVAARAAKKYRNALREIAKQECHAVVSRPSGWAGSSSMRFRPITSGERGGLPGVRDEHALESPLARPQPKYAYDPRIALARLAAAYAFGLPGNHPHHRGNKRISLLALVTLRKT